MNLESITGISLIFHLLPTDAPEVVHYLLLQKSVMELFGNLSEFDFVA
jgi:hypothetical protein